MDPDEGLDPMSRSFDLASGVGGEIIGGLVAKKCLVLWSAGSEAQWSFSIVTEARSAPVQPVQVPKLEFASGKA